MGMAANERGINWDRVHPDDFDRLAAIVEQAATNCGQVGDNIKRRDYYTHRHYVTRAGVTKCLDRATLALNGPAVGTIVRDILKRGLGTTNKAAFQAHVRRT